MTAMTQTATTSEDRFSDFERGGDMTWGAATPEAESAVNNAMRFTTGNMMGLVEEEAESDLRVPPSMAKRLAVIEDGLAKYRRAIKTHPDSEADSAQVQALVRNYLSYLLAESGVSEQLAKAIVSELRLR